MNEVRREQGLEEREDCDVILNATWLQASQAAQAQEAQEENVEVEGASPENGAMVQEEATEEGDKREEASEWKTWQSEGQEGSKW